MRTASEATLRARDAERRLYTIYVEFEKVCGDHLTDLGMATRLAWMESGRVLDRLCEIDGISQWSYPWPK